MTTVEEEEFKLVRMANSEIKDSKWILHMPHLLGEEEGIKHSHESHELLAVERSDYLDAFKEAGLEVKDFIEKGDGWNGARGLFLLKSKS